MIINCLFAAQNCEKPGLAGGKLPPFLQMERTAARLQWRLGSGQRNELQQVFLQTLPHQKKRHPSRLPSRHWGANNAQEKKSQSLKAHTRGKRSVNK